MLEQLRKQLTDVDDQIVELVARRQQLVRQIGESKRDSGRATRDFAREKRVIDGARAKASELGISEPLIEHLMKLLIEGSLERQERDNIAHSDRGHDQSALVIGGCGKMGRWFAEFLASQGFAVTVADVSTAESPFPRLDQWQDEVERFQVIALAAPIKVSAEILQQLATLRPPGLIFDLASLKSPLRRPLRALADAGCRVTSIHPMFGPDTRLLSGQHVIFVDVGVAEANAAAWSLFDQTMAERTEMSLEDHDRLIAYILGLSHALNIAFFTALRESGEAADRLSRLSSTTFDAQLSVANRVSAENPNMYFEIQSLNDYRRAPLNSLLEAMQRLKDMVEHGDEAGFVRLMQLGHDYLHQRQNRRETRG